MQRILIRHARPLIDPGICYGALDVPADALATTLAARALAPQLPTNFHAWVSPLTRCRQLADALQELRLDGVFTQDARLAEMDFGEWEGQAWTSIPRLAVDAWTADFAEHRFGGKESVSDVLNRVAAAWDVAQGVSLWITHAGVIRAATLIAAGQRQIERANQWPEFAPAYGEWVSLNVQ
jgi:alpha-ribazole phosphatase